MIDKEKIKTPENTDTSCNTFDNDQVCCSDDEHDASLQDTLNNVQNELDACNAKSKEWQDLYLRVMSDFQNFKARTTKEQATWRQSMASEILGQLLTIVDDFDRAFTGDAQTKDFAGFVMIHKSIIKFLEKFGVTPMINYTTFDPQYHEALMQVSSPEHAAGTIVQVLQKGYLLHDTVLRPAKVSVAQ